MHSFVASLCRRLCVLQLKVLVTCSVIELMVDTSPLGRYVLPILMEYFVVIMCTLLSILSFRNFTVFFHAAQESSCWFQTSSLGAWLWPSPLGISLGHARQFHDVRLTIASIRDSLDVDRPCQKTENKTFPAICVFAVKDGDSCCTRLRTNKVACFLHRGKLYKEVSYQQLRHY